MTPAPPEVLETPRMLLRAPRLADATMMHAAVHESIVHESMAELVQFMAWATPDYTLADAEKNTRAAMDLFRAREGLRYHFFDKVTGQFVGNASFHHIDWSVLKLELGYWLRTSRSGEGLMREGVSALSEMAERELGAVRLEIRCDERNVRSARVAEACGYELEGILRNEARDPHGQLRDTRLYARVPK